MGVAPACARLREEIQGPEPGVRDGRRFGEQKKSAEVKRGFGFGGTRRLSGGVALARRAVAFQLPVGARVAQLAVGPHLPVRARVALHAAAFPLAVRAGVALRAVAFPLPVGAGVALSADASHLAVRTRVALRAVSLQLPVRARGAHRARGFLSVMRAPLRYHHARTREPRPRSLIASLY